MSSSYPINGDVVVGEYWPLRPSPQTMQYGVTARTVTADTFLPSAGVKGEGWARAWLENHIDLAQRSFADRYFQPTEHYKWYYLTVDGWVLKFWDEELYDPIEAQQGNIFARAWLDLRFVHSVQTRRCPAVGTLHQCPVELLVHTRTGVFSFFLPRKEDAQAWQQRLTLAFVEWQNRELQVREEAIRDIAADRAAFVEQGRGGRVVHEQEAAVEDEHVNIPSYRAQLLRKLWIDCLRVASHGDKPRIWDDVFSLYDFNGDGTIQIDELERLLKELLAVRRDEVKRTIEEKLRDDVHSLLAKSSRDRADDEKLHKMGSELLAHYRTLMVGPSFRHRALVLRSQLDTSRDERISKDEFVRGAPALLLPAKELRMEAKFYERVGAKMVLDAERNGQVHDDSEDEGGCIQQ